MSSPPPKFIETKSKLNDTLVRYDIGASGLTDNKGSSVLFIRQGKEGPSFFSLNEGENHIGREPTCAVCIPRDEVSRKHAIVTVINGIIKIRDLGSSNGTYVNGKLTKKSKLIDGDIFNIGKTLRFVVSIRMKGLGDSDLGSRIPTVADKGITPPTSFPVAAGGATVESLEHERRQLAILLQISLKFLEAPPYKVVDILYDVLPRVVDFDAACIARKRYGKVSLSSHPTGITVPLEESNKFLSGNIEHAKFREYDAAPIEIEETLIHSVAVVPLEGYGTLCLLSKLKRAYSDELDFLSVLAKIFDSARASGQSQQSEE